MVRGGKWNPRRLLRFPRVPGPRPFSPAFSVDYRPSGSIFLSPFMRAAAFALSMNGELKRCLVKMAQSFRLKWHGVFGSDDAECGQDRWVTEGPPTWDPERLIHRQT